MVTPTDPYQFIFSECVISSSQEEILSRIPGWDDAKLNDSLTPSQPALAASQQQDLLKSSPSANSDSEDVSSQGEPARSLLGMQGPMEWASPETQKENEGDSYDAAFESDRSQSPCSSNRWYGPIMADLFTDRFITQSQVGSENLFESEPSTSKDMAHCLKTDEILAKLQGAKTGELVDSHAKDDHSLEFPFKIRKLGPASNSLVPMDIKGQRDNEKISCTRHRTKVTVVKKCLQSVQPEEPSHNPRSPDPNSPAESAERCIDTTAKSRENAGKSIDESGHANDCGQEHKNLIFENRDVERPDMENAGKSIDESGNANDCGQEHKNLIFENRDGERPDMSVKTLEDPVYVHQTSFEDFTNLKNKTFVPPISVLERRENGRKRHTEEGKLDSVTKALNHVNSDQGQTEKSSDAVGYQGLPATVKEVAFHEIQQSEVFQRLGKTANEDSLKNVSLDVSQLHQTACSAESPELQGSGRSNIPSATEDKRTARKTQKVARVESLRHEGNNKQSAEGKNLKVFPESVIDVVMLRSGCLPLCKPNDPDLLSLVIRSGVSLPLPVRRG